MSCYGRAFLPDYTSSSRLKVSAEVTSVRRYYVVPVLILAAVMQTTVLSRLPIHDLKIDLMIMLVVAETAFRGTRSGMIWDIWEG